MKCDSVSKPLSLKMKDIKMVPSCLITGMIVIICRGYLAPEYASYGELSEKADVYSFGVLCLEVVSGRKNIDSSKPVNQVYLPSWVIVISPILHGTFMIIFKGLLPEVMVCVQCFHFYFGCNRMLANQDNARHICILLESFRNKLIRISCEYSNLCG